MTPCVVTLLLAVLAPAAKPQPPSGFRQSAWFGEWVREEWIAEGVRVVANAPAKFDPAKPTRLVIYATPNGNTIEQTLGCATVPGQDWHFDIQHVAAQVRKLREVTPDANIVLACIEADSLSWPAWKRKYKDGPARVRKVVDAIRTWLPKGDIRLSLAGHSGGGSFLFGFIDGADEIPSDVERIVFLDANYSYSDTDRHGDKLLSWLKGDKARRLAVIAYDDRNIELDGKKVIGPDGGTFRATDRMATRFGKDATLTEKEDGDIVSRAAMSGQLALLVHANPKNRILHTALVGEMNGLLRGLGQPAFGEPRAYSKSIQPAPGIPKRPADAVGGAAFFKMLNEMSRTEREEAIAKELLRGNLPDFLRGFKKVTVAGKDTGGKVRTVELDVMPDYLAVGSDTDFVRVPITPQTAARVAEAFGCALPTRKIADDVYKAATVKLEPKPLTKDRELAGTFAQHNALIEEQRKGVKDAKLGELVAGVKKDVVVSNRVAERPNRVAIYGWHAPDGKPIQPLTVVHVDWYVDYSHGVRLMKRAVTVDGKPRDSRHILYSPDLHPLLSDEGPLTRPTY